MRARTAPARYGGQHRKLRRLLGPQVAAGGVACARCGEPILPGEPWDLGHVDGGNGYAGPEHRACNRATAGRQHADYRDDPEHGVYWGPPSMPGAEPRRWSRPWFPWR
jgi:hypothetical protein